MLRPALMFSDHAVLQRDKPIAVWGEATPFCEVAVAIQGQRVTTRADHKGAWRVYLAPLQVSFAEVLEIAGDGETLQFQDIQVGDVFLAGGQSNMEFHMRYDADMSTEKERCINPNIRFFDYPEVSYVGQLEEADYSQNYGFWRPCTPEHLERFSAVAYYCVRDLQARYQIPMGILACNWGGTPAMAWIPMEVAAENGDAHRIADYAKALEQLDLAEYNAKFAANPMSFRTDQLSDSFSDMLMFGIGPDELEAKMAALMQQMGVDPAKTDFASFMPAMGPKHEWRPAGVYQSMLLPCVPYGIRGVLWYQGCSDSDAEQDARGYDKVFPALIRHWRALWGENLPFVFVQLAPFRHWMQNLGTYFPITRKAQQWTVDHVENTAMAVTTDVGMEWDIHPKKKQPVGQRMALLCEHLIYGEDVLCEAPTLVSAEIANSEKANSEMANGEIANSVVLHFQNVGEGLHLAETLPYGDVVGADVLGGLTITQNGQAVDLAGAKAVASGDTVTVTGIQVTAPITVELACTDWYLVNLYNSADIPARPASVQIP